MRNVPDGSGRWKTPPASNLGLVRSHGRFLAELDDEAWGILREIVEGSQVGLSRNRRRLESFEDLSCNSESGLVVARVENIPRM